MSRKTIALNLDEVIYQKYKEHCKENAIILSRKVDEFMKSELVKKRKK